MSNARALSSDDIRGLREELASGSTPTVWFTASAVGVHEGRSGKVTALDEPAEGDFIQVRPAGSKDVLSFSAGEVTVVKPARKRKEPQPPAGKPPAGNGSGPPGKSTADPPVHGGTPARSRSGRERESKSGGAQESQPDGKPAPSEPTRSTTGSRGRTRQPAGATVTLTAGSEGQWHVEVNNGKKRVVRPTPVSASAVASAAKELHDDVAQAVEPLLEAAREHQRSRVEQLQQELSDAQRMLDDLTG